MIGKITLNEQNRDTDGAASAMVGCASVALLILGTASFLAAWGAIANGQDFTGAGMCAIASALSFGLLLNAISRR